MVKPWLHSTGDASARAALLRPQIHPVFSVVAPGPRGASPVSVPRQGFATGCQTTSQSIPRGYRVERPELAARARVNAPADRELIMDGRYMRRLALNPLNAVLVLMLAAGVHALSAPV